MKEKILIIDDEADIRDIVKDILNDEGYLVETAENSIVGNAKMLEFDPDAVLLDIWMPTKEGTSNEEGITLLKKWHDKKLLDTPVIMISGHGNVETAVEAVKIGAYDFLEKPLSTAKLLLTVERALQTRALRQENKKLKNVSFQQQELIGNSKQIIELRRQINLLGPTNSWIFLTGESGSGKGIVAQCVHHASKRSGAFVQLNLAATPLESVATRLFGAELATGNQLGCFENAHQGTLFINEVLDLDLEIQGKLLSALQDQQFLRVGGNQYIDFDVRVISATSGDPEAAVRAGRFREDLYYRLNVIPIIVPALRHRIADIQLLAEFHGKRLSELHGLKFNSFPEEVIKPMCSYDWPGNIRQLINVINRLILLNQDGVINAEKFEESIAGEGHVNANHPESLPDYFNLDLRQAKENFEKTYLLHHLSKANYNISKLSENIGMERTHLYRKIKSLGIDPKKAS